MDDHRARLQNGLKVLGLEVDLGDAFQDAENRLVTAGCKAFGDELYLRVNLTTGVMVDIAGTDQGAALTGFCKPFKPYPMQYYVKGVHLVVSNQRKDPRDPLATIKTLRFLPYVAARRQVMACTAHDGLLLNQEGRVGEAPTSNLFAFKDGIVYVPGASEGALSGVTRAAVLEPLEDVGLPVEERLDLAWHS